MALKRIKPPVEGLFQEWNKLKKHLGCNIVNMYSYSQPINGDNTSDNELSMTMLWMKYTLCNLEWQNHTV